MAVSTLQVANPAVGTVTRQAQTTAQPVTTQAPFTRISRLAQIPGPTTTGLAFGASWTPPLKPVGGYLRRFDLTVQATGGAASGTNAVLSADAPYNALQNLYIKDPFGQPIFQADGYSAYLIDLYSGQLGMLGFGNNIATMPSFVPATVGGNFTFHLQVPFEADSSAYCSLADMNAASQPSLLLILNPAATVYSTSPGTLPTFSLNVDEPYWTAPIENPAVAPPDVGSSLQWSVNRAAAGIGSSAFQRIQLAMVGSYLTTLILVLRDATGARVEAFPNTDLQFVVDSVPLLMETLAQRSDRMWEMFGVTRPVGVIVYSFRNSVQSAVSTADTYDLLLNTTPATDLEIWGTWGTIANAPAQLQQICGQLFPFGGIPYSHLAG
jgi:hypothetical protein